MNVIAVIPARFKSSRFEGKPLAMIEGKPMVYWVYQSVSRVENINRAVVATDDERIEQACSSLGIEVVMTRSDHLTGTDRVAEVATKISADLYLNVQGDEPMLKPDTISKILGPALSADASVRVINLMTRIRRFTDLNDSTVPKVVVNHQNDAVYLSRFPIPYPKDAKSDTYWKQICVYAFRPDALTAFARLKPGSSESAEGIELLRFIEHGIRVRMVEVDQDTVAVDTPADLSVVRRIFAGAGV